MKHKLFHVITTAALTMSLLIGSAFCENETYDDFSTHRGYVPLSVEITPEYTIKLPAVIEFEEISKNTYVANVPAIANISIGSNNMLCVHGFRAELTLENILDNPQVYQEYLTWFNSSVYKKNYGPESETIQMIFLKKEGYAVELSSNSDGIEDGLYFVEEYARDSDIINHFKEVDPYRDYYEFMDDEHNDQYYEEILSQNVIHCKRGVETNSADANTYISSYKLVTSNPKTVKVFGTFTGKIEVSYNLITL